MSAVGPSNPAGFNLAGSFAGAQRTSSQTDETKSQQATQKMQAEQTASGDKDVAEAEMDADRDADGRQGYAASDGGVVHENSGEDDSSKSPKSKGHVPDAFGERGGQLDLDA